jgi:hypothetical protein
MRYAKTDAGQQAFKARSPLFSARQRSAFILIDGVKTRDELLAASAGLGVTGADLDHLLAQGLIAVVAAGAGGVDLLLEGEPEQGATGRGSGRTPQDRYAQAYPLAVQLASSLGLRGFTLNLAVEAAADFDGLAALLPRMQKALGNEACAPLARVLFD